MNEVATLFQNLAYPVAVSVVLFAVVVYLIKDNKKTQNEIIKESQKTQSEILKESQKKQDDLLKESQEQQKKFIEYLQNCNGEMVQTLNKISQTLEAFSVALLRFTSKLHKDENDKFYKEK